MKSFIEGSLKILSMSDLTCLRNCLSPVRFLILIPSLKDKSSNLSREVMLFRTSTGKGFMYSKKDKSALLDLSLKILFNVLVYFSLTTSSSVILADKALTNALALSSVY